MAEIIRYVDPDATGNDDGTSWTDAYTSLSDCEENERADLDTDEDWLHIFVRNPGDTTAVSFSSAFWTTSSEHRIVIEAASSDYASKTGWDSNKYSLSVSGDNALSILVDVTVKGLQLESDTSGTIRSDSDNKDVKIIDCYIRPATGSTNNRGITINNANATVTIENTIITGYPYDGILVYDSSSVKIYNCIVYDSGYDGIEFDGGTGTIKNCAVFESENSADFDIAGGASVTIDYNASDDGDGTNSVSPDGSDWTNEFSDPANGDFTLLNTGNLYDAGVGPSTDSDVPTTDIDGDSRSGTTCDIGADEYVSGGTAYTETFLDNLGLTDTTISTIAYIKSILNDLNISDSLIDIRNVFKIFNENIEIIDNLNASIILKKIISDNIVLTDNIAISIGILRLIEDNLNITDELNSKVNIAKILIESIGVNDSLFLQNLINISILDSVTLSDIAINSNLLSKKILDSINISDVQNKARNIIKTVIETLVITDDLNKIVQYIRLFSENIGLEDNILNQILVSILLSDSIELSDTIDTDILIKIFLEDTIGLTDDLDRIAYYTKIFAENIGIVDTFKRALNYTVSMHDSTMINDNFLIVNKKFAAISDIIGIVDQNIINHIADVFFEPLILRSLITIELNKFSKVTLKIKRNSKV